MALSVQLVEMMQIEYDRYRREQEREYAESIARSGSMPREEARAKAKDDLARLLPRGLQTPGMLFYTARDGDQRVGMVWLQVRSTSQGPEVFVYDFEVRETSGVAGTVAL